MSERYDQCGSDMVKVVAEEDMGVDRLIRLLEVDDISVREHAKEELIAMGEPVVAALLEEMGRRAGCRHIRDVLIGIGEPAILPCLNSFRNNGGPEWAIIDGSPVDVSIRWDLIDTLAGIGGPVFEIVSDLLESEEAFLRSGAARVLGRMEDLRAVNSLCRVLTGDSDGGPRAAAAQALGDGGCVDVLIRALEDEDWMVRFNAVRSLCLIKDQRVVEPLVGLLEDGYGVKVEADEVAGWLEDERVIPSLIWAVGPEMGGSGCATCRSKLYEGLKSCGNEKVVSMLIGLFRSGREISAKRAARLLGEMEDYCLEPLLMVLEDEDPRVRCYAADALGWMDDDRARKSLEALAGDVEKVRQEAGTALEKIRLRREAEEYVFWNSQIYSQCLNCGKLISGLSNFCSKSCEQMFLDDLCEEEIA